ncbi:MAG: hypothetical protein D6726_12795 [Nitrospirae bacterium]|nr:MAG: hypothetical protein D6726_12795 [Nitrospirota bacterium]
MATIPDFKTFGKNGYRSRLIQRGNTVTLSQKTYLASIAFSVFGAIAGFFLFVPMVMKGDYSITFGRVFLFVIFVLSEGGALLYALYREEVFFDFGGKYYCLRKGFFWNIKEVKGFFNDIQAVTVREARRSTDSHYKYWTYSIGVEFRKEGPTFDIWQTTDREKARYISDTLADAFGVKVMWEPDVIDRKVKRLFGVKK